MTTATLATVTRPSEEAIIGIDRALSYFEQELAKSNTRETDFAVCLRTAQAWLMTIQSEIHADNVTNEA